MPILRDRFGVELTAARAEAVTCLDAAIEEFLRFGTKGGDHLGQALTHDPDLVLGHCLFAYFMRLGNDPALFLGGRDAMIKAQRIVAQGQVTARERHHAAAVQAWYHGDWTRATVHWETAINENPRDILALWVSQLVMFFQGRMGRMRDCAARLLPLWQEGEPGTDYVQGMYAFGLAETSDFARAEALGRRASERNPGGVWSVHAVAHVFEATGRPRDGIRWLTGLEKHWTPCGNFAYHMWWHRALYHLDLEQFDTVLDLYDRGVRPLPSMDYMDISNAVGLLWRLRARGVDVGRRFDELGEKCVLKKDDHLLPFSQAHFALALASTGRREALRAMVESTRLVAAGDSTLAQVTRALVLPLATACALYERGDYAGALAKLMPVRYDVLLIGGSHAQRDLFAQWIIECALKAGDHRTAKALLAERTAAHPQSPWGWRRFAAALHGLGEEQAASDAENKAKQLLGA
ncbi:MAG: tetratricopeptide repeat protein [Alphaproteobacteria bacterium]|nr:tetratricopeptide repeat protein [Alphaproteobacteria bacterium]